MKQRLLMMGVLLLGIVPATVLAAEAHEDRRYRYNDYGDSFIFVERGITFAVYPDGEFDFYVDQAPAFGAAVRIGNAALTFNSGFDYNPFVQYDDYGAVIQVENVPIFYDNFGRVAQIGSVDIFYRRGLVHRVGGLNIFYNGGVFTHYTGFINIYNRRYIFRPWHRFFVRPAIGFCNVWTSPYRQFYRPIRYTYYAPYRDNFRRRHFRIGRQHRYVERAPRARVYRNDRRVTVNRNVGRRGGNVARNDARTPSVDRSVRRNGNSAQRQGNTVRRSGNSAQRQGNTVRRSGNSTQRQGNTVRRSGNSTQRQGNTVRRSGNSTQRQGNTVRRSGNSVKRSSNTVKRSSTSRRTTTVKRGNTQTVRKSTKSTTVRKKAPARKVQRSQGRSTRGNNSKSTRRSSSRSNRSGRQ